ncbi:Methyltransferase adrK [Pseudocercospora fuligena]|uniref:Methyltransferase adrK n=1 Tax=Pseudocercospora fuligena TaxID=685502 RepID=A0A8H6RKM2_9PEZI|nr:Methyltransferase adrK [Pseudocercospora fuligena]
MASTESRDETYTYEQTLKKEDAPHWQGNVEKVLQDRTRQMLQTYSRIASSDVVAHIEHAQQRAWDLAPFASVGAMTWLNSYLRLHISYDTVLDRVKAGASILDCGCMIAPDLRELAYAGTPSDKMYGFDIQSEFFDIGYDFYKDRNSFKAHFFPADVVKDFSESELASLAGQIDIICLGQESMFLGSQNGYPGGHDILIRDGSQRILPQSDRIFLGDAEQIKEIWTEVGEKTNTKWKVESRLLDLRTIGLHDDDGSPYKKFTGYNLQWTATMC